MALYKTGNPVPSSAMPDVWDNNRVQDEILNSEELEVETRTGIMTPTWKGVLKKNEDEIEETRQNLIPLSRQYMTLAAAQADIANIPLGSTTYYRSPDDSALAVEVINNAGTLQPTGRKMPSQGAVDDYFDAASSSVTSLITSDRNAPVIIYERLPEAVYGVDQLISEVVFGVDISSPVNCLSLYLAARSTFTTAKLQVFSGVPKGSSRSDFINTHLSNPDYEITYKSDDIFGAATISDLYYSLAKFIHPVVSAGKNSAAGLIIYRLQLFDGSGSNAKIAIKRTNIETSPKWYDKGIFKQIDGSDFINTSYQLACKLTFEWPKIIDNTLEAGDIAFTLGAQSAGSSYDLATNFFTGWIITIDTFDGDFDFAKIRLRVDGTQSSLHYIWGATKRADLSKTSAPSSKAGDIFLDSGTIDLTGLPVGPFESDVDIPYVYKNTYSDYVPFLVVMAKNSDGGNAYTHIVIDYDSPDATINEKGFYIAGTTVGYVSTSGRHVAYTLHKKRIDGPIIAAPSTNALFDVSSDISVSGLTASISMEAMSNGQQKRKTQTVQTDPSTMGSATVTTNISVQSASYNFNPWLGYRNISNVVVKDSSGNTLTEGTHYSVDYNRGVLNTSITGGYQGATVKFDYAIERYDVIAYNPFDGGISLIKGTERAYDPQEYFPQVTPPLKPLYSLYVTGDKMEAFPLYGQAKMGSGFYTKDLSLRDIKIRNLQILSGVKAKLAAGNQIKLVGYGDSITACGGSNSAAFSTPNGSRDLPSYYDGFPSDTTAGIQLYDFGDGQGVAHVKIGWNWALKEHIESTYGAEVSYLNYGCNGTTSGSGASANRINYVLDQSPDLAVVCFGMNDGVNVSTYTNLVSIINQLRSVGCAVIIMPVPRVPDTDKGLFMPVKRWDLVNSYCYQAALDAGAAYIPADRYMSSGIAPCSGISTKNMCGINFINHPSMYELKLYGKLLVEFF